MSTSQYDRLKHKLDVYIWCAGSLKIRCFGRYHVSVGGDFLLTHICVFFLFFFFFFFFYRSAYCAASVASLTNILTPKLFEDTTNWILRYNPLILI